MTDPLIGSTTAVFDITLSVALTEPVDVAWSTKDGTAIAGTDYEAANGVVTFLPGETSKQIQVTVYGQDVGVTLPKNFYITLTPPSNAIRRPPSFTHSSMIFICRSVRLKEPSGKMSVEKSFK